MKTLPLYNPKKLVINGYNIKAKQNKIKLQFLFNFVIFYGKSM